MKKLILSSFILLFTLTSCFAQKREERNVGYFNKVKAGGSFDVFIKKGNKENVVIEAQEGPIDRIETEVEGNTLHIYMENDWWKNYSFRNVNIFVTVTELEGVVASGSGNMRVQTDIEGDDVYIGSSGSGNLICEARVSSSGDMKISNSGSGNCKIQSSVLARDQLRINNSGSGNMYVDNLTSEDLDVNNSGSGGLEVYDGSIQYQNIVMSGSGDVKLGDVKSEDCRISKSGSGNIYVYVNHELTGNSSGSGNVYLRGNNPRMNFSSSGSGKIKTMN